MQDRHKASSGNEFRLDLYMGKADKSMTHQKLHKTEWVSSQFGQLNSTRQNNVKQFVAPPAKPPAIQGAPHYHGVWRDAVGNGSKCTVGVPCCQLEGSIDCFLLQHAKRPCLCYLQVLKLCLGWKNAGTDANSNGKRDIEIPCNWLPRSPPCTQTAAQMIKLTLAFIDEI